MLRYPGVKASDLKQAVPELHDVDEGVLGRVDVDGEGAVTLDIFASSYSPQDDSVGKYNAHIFRQEADLRVFMEDESLTLDPHMDYGTVTGLSSEVRERLFRVRPTTIVCFSLFF